MSHLPHQCPLCLQACNDEYGLTVGQRYFFHCHYCQLLSVSRSSLPNLQDEKDRYLLHQNTEDDEGYVKFLMQVVAPLIDFVPSRTLGLDYGCGPNPVLASKLIELGYQCDFYDPFFYPNLSDKYYDFITATECFEHFHRPAVEIAHIIDLLNVGGILAVMTETWSSIDQLSNWYYLRDFTHVSVYHHDTMLWLCKSFGMDLIHSDHRRVYIFKKQLAGHQGRIDGSTTLRGRH